MDKSALRKRYRQERTLMNPKTIDLNNWRHILTMPELISSKIVATYHSYGDEPETAGLNQELLNLGKELVLPKVRPDMNLDWISWNGTTQELTKRFNFFEPTGDPISAAQIDFVIIPCLHVTRSGHRLGQGGGSYDRALSAMRAFKLGLIYSGEITAEPMPIQAHDQKLDAVATPEIIVRF
jgi:5-formyltetrahydrofolate cyclo-ligase